LIWIMSIEILNCLFEFAATYLSFVFMNEIIFLVENAVEGGYTARALGASIFTEADDLESLRENVREAVDCHFESEEKPKMIRLHFVSEEVLAV
jgi:hypothetical protein